MYTLTELGTRLTGETSDGYAQEITQKMRTLETRLRAAMANELLPQPVFQRISTLACAAEWTQKAVAQAMEKQTTA
jgi:hypothetical protein